MNFGQLKQRACVFAGDTNQTRYNSLVADAVNEANEQFVFDSKCLFTDAPTYTVVDGTPTYSLPADFLVERMVTHKGLKLSPKSKQQLAMDFPGEDWTIKYGTPRAFNIDPSEANKTLRVVPIPQADDAGANLILSYSPVPVPMASDADLPLNGYVLLAPYHIAIARYAANLLLESESVMTPETLNKIALNSKRYDAKVVDAIDQFGDTKSANFTVKTRKGRLWI